MFLFLSNVDSLIGETWEFRGNGDEIYSYDRHTTLPGTLLISDDNPARVGYL